MKGGVAVASTNSWEARSSTTGGWLLVSDTGGSPSLTVVMGGSDGGPQLGCLKDHLRDHLRLGDGDRMGGARNRDRAARPGALGHEALDGGWDVAVRLTEHEP